MKKYLFTIVSVTLLVVIALLTVHRLQVRAWTITDQPVSYGYIGAGNVQLFDNNNRIDLAFDSSGNIYVIQDNDKDVVKKYDSNWNFLTEWGGTGSGDGLLNHPNGIAIDSNNNVYITDTVNNRVQKFTSAGVFITKWGSTGSGDGQFNVPRGVDVDSSGNVYVVDRNNHRVQKFDSSGNFLDKVGSNGSGDGQFFQPQEISISSEGSVWVDDMSNHRMQKFDSDLNFILKFGSLGSGNGQFSSPQGIDVDSSDNLFVIDLNKRVQKFNSSGVYQSQFGSSGTGDGQFNSVSGLAITSNNTFYIPDIQSGSTPSRIQKFDANGNFLSKFGELYYGNGQFLWPYAIDTDSVGNIYVVDSSNDRVQKFNSSGVYIRKWGTNGTGDGQFDSTYGLSIDASDNIYVTDYYNSRVQKFDSDGNFISKFGTTGSGSGQFSGPFGLAFDSAGNIYVADSGNNRVQKFNSSHTYVATITGNGGAFYAPEAIVVDTSDNIYILDSGNNRVQKFNSSLIYLTQWIGNGTAFNWPDGMTIDSENNVYVADTQNNRIQVFNSSGSFLAEFGSYGQLMGQLERPTGLHVGANGKLYVSDGPLARVQTFNFDRAPATVSINQFPANNTTDTTPIFTGTVTDTLTAVTSVEFSTDSSGSWSSCIADDGAFDELTETFSCTVPSSLSVSSHTVDIRSTDSATNTNTGGTIENYEYNIVLPTNPGGGSDCTSLAPVTAPNLFSAVRIGNNVELAFAPVIGSNISYMLLYGYFYGDERFGTTINVNYSTAAIKYIIHSLALNKSYTFWLRAVNGCAAGPNSNYLIVSVDGGGTSVNETPTPISKTDDSETNQGGENDGPEEPTDNPLISPNNVDNGQRGNNIDNTPQVSGFSTSLGEITNNLTLAGVITFVSVATTMVVANTLISSMALSSELLNIYSTTGRSVLYFPHDLAFGFWQYLSYMTTSYFTVLTGIIIKKRKYSGRVFNSITKFPVTGAFVIFYSKSGNLKTAVTDKKGYYSVMLLPDTYELRVRKNEFTFPSKVVTTAKSAEFDHIYTIGEKIEITKGVEKISNIAIPIDPVSYTNNFSKTITKITDFTSTVLDKLSYPLIILGLVTTGYATISNPTMFNKVAYFATYFFLFGNTIKVVRNKYSN